MSDAVIGAGGESLTLTRDDYDRNADTVVAELRVGALSASALVYDHAIGGLADFFASLARDWLGWDGERRWDSVEEDLGIGAFWKSGFARLRITLRQDWTDRDNRGNGWQVTAWVSLQCGEELSQAATDVGKLFHRG